MANPELTVVGGANGCGKTTFALEYSRQISCDYLSADAVASEIRPDAPETASVAAGKEFLRRVRSTVDSGRSLIIESTLAGRSLRNTLHRAQELGFEVTIVYLFVDSPDTCVERVRERVEKGGHFVPIEDIRRRFPRSLQNFWRFYRSFADQWLLIYNAGKEPVDVAVGTARGSSVRDIDLYALFQQLVEGDICG